MSLINLLRRQRPRSFSNRMNAQSLPIGDFSEMDFPELDPLPLDVQQLAGITELAQAVQADVPTRRQVLASLPGGASRAAPTRETTSEEFRLPGPLLEENDLTDLERELTSRQMLPRPAVSRPLPRRLDERPVPSGGGNTEGTLLERMLRDPGSQRMFRAAQREITNAPVNQLKDYALAAAGIPAARLAAPIVRRAGQAGGASIDALKDLLIRMGMAPDDVTEAVRATQAARGLSVADNSAVRQSVLGIPAAAESAASAFRLSPRQLELPTGMRREFRMLPPNEPPVASVDDGLRQLGLSFDDAADVSPAYRVIEAVKTPVTRPKTPTKAAPKVAPKRTSAAKADASAKAAEAKRAENIARLKESQARVAAGKSLAKKSAPITRITSEEIARATEEFLKRGGVVERLAPGQSGLPTPPVPVAASTGPSLQEALLQNVNLALGQREANRRGRQKVWGMAPIIAAILGGQSFQN